MKSLDLTKPGGFPFTQDQLGYLQTAWTEALSALGRLGGSGPFVLSGIAETGSVTWGDGWLFYNNEVIRFAATTIGGGAPAMGYEYYVVITDNATPLTFYDRSTPNVVLEKVANMQVLASSTATDASHFKYSALDYRVPYELLTIANLNASTITLDKDKTVFATATTAGIDTINVDETGAVPGKEVNIIAPTVGTETLNIVPVASEILIITGPATMTHATVIWIRMKFLGNHYISVEIINPS